MFDRAVALELLGAGRCACESCAGELTDAELSKGGWRFCRICRCAWQISVINGQAFTNTDVRFGEPDVIDALHTHPNRGVRSARVEGLVGIRLRLQRRFLRLLFAA